MGKPLVSVIMPVYNTLAYIQRGIDSVLDQTYENVELIIVNDGSTDGSKHFLTEIGRNNSKIKIIHQNNLGVSAARNRGLDVMKGEFACFLDSDDWLLEDAIEFLYSQLSYRQHTISACDRNFVKISNGEFIKIRKRTEQLTLYLSSEDALLETGTGRLNLQSACYKLFPAELINGRKKIRFREDISHGEDGLFVFDVLHRATGIVFSTEPKWNILNREDSATRSGYSQKMLSALDAVDNMIYKSQTRAELQEQLKVYYTKRALGLIAVYSRSNYCDIEQREVLRSAAKRYGGHFLKYAGFIDKLKYCGLLYLPGKITGLLYRMKEDLGMR